MSAFQNFLRKTGPLRVLLTLPAFHSDPKARLRIICCLKRTLPLQRQTAWATCGLYFYSQHLLKRDRCSGTFLGGERRDAFASSEDESNLLSRTSISFAGVAAEQWGSSNARLGTLSLPPTVLTAGQETNSSSSIYLGEPFLQTYWFLLTQIPGQCSILVI